MRRARHESGEAVWAPVADAMTLVAAVFFLVFLAVYVRQQQLAAETQALLAEARACEQQRDWLQREQRRAGQLLVDMAADVSGVSVRDGQLSFDDKVLFPVNSAELLPSGRAVIRRLAPAIADAAAKNQHILFIVEGHTDDKPFPDDRFGNWKLSARRAANVVSELLAADVGIPPQRILAIGRGESVPAVADDPGHEQNRRVEIRTEIVADSVASRGDVAGAPAGDGGAP